MSGSLPSSAGRVRLHWLVALLVMVMWTLGQFMSGLPRDDALKGLVLGWHLGVGVAVLALTCLWLFLRRGQGPADAHRDYPPWRRRLIRVVHTLLFGLLIALPLAGLSVYLVDPHLGGPALLGDGVFAGNLAGNIYRFHYLGAWLLALLVAMHVVGAVWPGPGGPAIIHMLPGRRSGIPAADRSGSATRGAGDRPQKSPRRRRR